jgi:hypothetical protein
MGNAFGFVTSKEVVVAPWFKKPDVEYFDAIGELRSQKRLSDFCEVLRSHE